MSKECLGVQWSRVCQDMPPKVENQLLYLTPLILKMETTSNIPQSLEAVYFTPGIK